VQLRAHGGEHRAVVTPTEAGDEVGVRLLDPAQGIAPGQAAVVYDGSRVVGSVTIAATRRTAAAASA
jgi:tRNA-specific 2-thiouridylase